MLVAAAALATCAYRTSGPDRQQAEQRVLVQRSNFVHVKEAVPGIVIDLPYTTRNNIAGRPLYPKNMPCLVHRDTARRLTYAQRFLEGEGYSLKIWDAWRPPSSHMALWHSNPNPDYLAPPENGLSLHCYGVAVDVTLVQLDGSSVKMPSRFDEFSPRARYEYTGDDPQVRRNVGMLKLAMEKAGFVHIQSEWWHYVDPKAFLAHPVLADQIGIDLPVPTVKLTYR